MNKSLLLTLGLLLAGCSSTSSDSGKNTGGSDTPGAATLKLNWHYDNPEWYISGYSTLLGDLYMKAGNVKAYNVHTQQPAFEVPLTTDRGRSSYAAMDDHILVLTKDNQLAILDRTGHILNTISTGVPNVTIGNVGPYVTDTAVYFALGKTVFSYARSELLKPGVKPAWTWQPPFKTYGFIMSLNVLSDDEIIISAIAGDEHYNRLISLKADRAERWNIEQNPSKPAIQTSTAFTEVYGNTLITHAATQGLQAYDRTTGQPVWDTYQDIDNYCEGGGVGHATQATIADGKVFLAPFGNRCLMAFDAGTGKFLWSFKSPYYSSFMNKMLYLNDVVYASNGRLWALDADTGKLLATAREDLKPNYGTPLAYDPIKHQLLEWGGTGVFSYQPLK